MKELLKTLFAKAIELGDYEFTPSDREKKWLGKPSVSSEEILKAEIRLNQTLPEDYKEFLSLTNGFPELTIVEPSFHQVDDIDWLKNVDPELIEIYKDGGHPEDYKNLSNSIIIGGIKEEQSFLIIPRQSDTNNWIYWKYAPWDPIGEFYPGLKEYFKDIIEFMIEEIKKKLSFQPLKFSSDIN